MCFTRDDFEENVNSMIEFDHRNAMRELMGSIDLARERLPGIPNYQFGKLEVLDEEAVTADLDVVDESIWIDPVRGGTVKTPESGDSPLTRRIVETYGIEGTKITGGLEFP